MEKQHTTTTICAPQSYRAKHSLKGAVPLSDVPSLGKMYFGELNISEAEFGYEDEKWEQVLGYGHGCGPVIGRTGIRKVDVLQRFLENVRALQSFFQDDIKRRHINILLRHKNVRVIKVGPDCKLFTMDGDRLTNKNGTKIIFDPAIEAPQSDVRIVYAIPNPHSNNPNAYWIDETTLKMGDALSAMSEGTLSKIISTHEKSRRPENMNNPVLCFVASPINADGIPFSSYDVADILESLGYEIDTYLYSYLDPEIICVCIKPDKLQEIFDSISSVVN